MTEKINVIGKNAHPFYIWAKKNYGLGAIPKWGIFIRLLLVKMEKLLILLPLLQNQTQKKILR